MEVGQYQMVGRFPELPSVPLYGQLYFGFGEVFPFKRTKTTKHEGNSWKLLFNVVLLNTYICICIYRKTDIPVYEASYMKSFYVYTAIKD